jgi:putative DNA primase/helicase
VEPLDRIGHQREIGKACRSKGAIIILTIASKNVIPPRRSDDRRPAEPARRSGRRPVGRRAVTAAEIAVALGNARPEGREWRCDCPVCNRHNLTLSDGDSCLLVHCFNGCGAEQVLAELRSRGFFGSTNGKTGEPHVDTHAEHEAKANSAKAKRQRRIDNALDIWRNSVPAEDTMAATYLASRLLLPKPMPATLRLAPAVYHKESGARYPALIGLAEHTIDGPIGIHAIFLNRLDASERFTTEPRKKSFGPVKGGAVRLAPAGPVIAVAEGVEDAITFQEATATPSWPPSPLPASEASSRHR